MIDPTALLSQHPVWTALVASTATAGAVAKGFDWFDAALNGDSKLKLSLWLLSVPGDEQIDAWAAVFPTLIDRVFGPKPLSWKFFFRSCIASFIAVGLVFTGFIIHNGISWSMQGFDTRLGAVLGYAILALLMNGVPDYLSVLTTRLIVRLMSQRPTIFRTLLLLLLDTVLTAGIALMSIVLCLLIGSAFLAEEYGLRGYTLASLFHEQVTYANLFGRDSAFPVFFLAAFFTSIWVWLYVLSSITIRILHKFRAAWMKLLPALNVEDKPMQVVGRVAGVIAGWGYLILLSGVWLFRHI